VEPQRVPRVTLTGERHGDYVVIEERPDGSLVLAPAPTAATPHRTSPPQGLGGLAGLLARRPRSGSLPDVLDELGIVLAPDERVDEFLLAEVNGTNGFAVLTNRRFIFSTHAHARGRGGISREQPLSALRADLVKRGRRRSLRLSWDGGEMVVEAPDRTALDRWQQKLAAGEGAGRSG
jgi:hypothetical protein